MLKREDGRIDWRMSAIEIARRVRAFQPWPGTYTESRLGRLTIWRATDAPETASANGSVSAAEAGTIINIDDSGIMVVCSGPSGLLVEEVQAEGRRRVSAREFANGARLNPGDRINPE
jgi:methionyl-tRNA formyltransferase